MFIQSVTSGRTVAGSKSFCCAIACIAVLFICSADAFAGEDGDGEKLGACCKSHGPCVLTTEEDCRDGIFLGVGTTCENGACDTAWCGVPQAGDCFEGHGGLGCNIEKCCLLTCSVDPFCCEVGWDGLCADVAKAFCAECPQTICQPQCREDFDGSGSVDAGDLLVLLSQWGDKSVRDLNYNLYVDGDDLLILLSNWGSCQGQTFEEAEPCGELANEGCLAPAANGSDCCVAHETPGCDAPSCEEIVCLIDPFCCEVEWDWGCAFEARDSCGSHCDPPADAFATIQPGETVCGTIFAEDGLTADWYEFTLDESAFVTWIVSCDFGGAAAFIANEQCPPVKLAHGNLSGLPCRNTTYNVCLEAGTYRAVVQPNVVTGLPCDNELAYTATLVVENEGCIPSADNCADAYPITEGTTFFSNIAADTDGITPPKACVGGSGFKRDIWFTYMADCTGVLTLSTCNNTTIDTLIAVYDTCHSDDCPPDNSQLIGCNSNSPGCGFTTILQAEVVAGQCYKVRIGSSGGGQGFGLLTVECK